MRSALLLRLGGLGDLLVALPALRLLRAAFPEASLRLVAGAAPGALLRGAGVVDAASPADDPAWMPLFDGGLPASSEFRAALGRVDLIAGWFHGASGRPSWWKDRLPGGAGPGAGAPPALRAFTYDAESGVPISRFFFDRTAEFVRVEGRPIADFEDCRLLFGGPSRPRGRFGVVHPGSGGRLKRWPLGRFRDVIEALAADGLEGLVVTGEAEAPLEGELAAMPLPQGWRRAVQPPLPELADALRGAAVYVGNDSGVTHLAAACGTAAIAVFRDEFASAWRPFGRATVLSAPRVEEVAASEVIAAARRALGRSRP